jgi:hypothetical protein
MEAATAPWRVAQERLVGAMGVDGWAALDAALRNMIRIADHV